MGKKCTNRGLRMVGIKFVSKSFIHNTCISPPKKIIEIPKRVIFATEIVILAKVLIYTEYTELE